jgi:hypothetical protein
VMRYGCWRGKVFEGCEPRRGESNLSNHGAFGHRGEAARTKRGEPLAGCGVQQTCNFSAE